LSAAATVPEVASLDQARALITEQFHTIQQLHWQVSQLKKELFGASSERQTESALSKEQILLSLFPAPAQPAATQDVVLPPTEERTEARARRQPAAKVLETVTERIEPQEKVCAHCGKAKCEIGCEKSERFEYVPAKIVRHEIIRPKLACPCGEGGVSTMRRVITRPIHRKMPTAYSHSVLEWVGLSHPHMKEMDHAIRAPLRDAATVQRHGY